MTTTYHNAPAANTRRQALVEFAKRNTPAGRSKLTYNEWHDAQACNAGVCYQGDGGSTEYIDWADLTPAEVALIYRGY